MEEIIAKLTKNYTNKCEKWVANAEKSCAKKTASYKKMALPNYNGEPFSEKEFAQIMR